MNLWLSTHFLVAGMFLSSSAMTPEECGPLITPLSLANSSMMFGRSHFLFGYTDNGIYNDVLKLTDSYWIDVNAASSSREKVVMSSGSKINGSCLSLHVNGTVDGDAIVTTLANLTSRFHLLPAGEGYQVYSINCTATDLDKMMTMMKIHSNATAEKVNIRALYLMASGTTVKDSDLEDFKKQASCLGFHGEPDYTYDHKNGFCAEGEGTVIYDNYH